MQAQGYLAKPQRSPTSFALAFAITGAGVAALVLANPYVRSKLPLPPIVVEMIKLPEPPPPTPQPKTPQAHAPAPTPVPQPRLETPPRIVETPPVGPALVTGGASDGLVNLPPIPPIEIAPVKAPVLTGARPDPRYARELQPPYPPALQREEVEGTVTVRVHVGADGRVLAVEPVRTDHEGFLSATREWAMRHWRFVPATRDGTPVDSWRTMTVRFNIDRG